MIHLPVKRYLSIGNSNWGATFETLPRSESKMEMSRAIRKGGKHKVADETDSSNRKDNLFVFLSFFNKKFLLKTF